MAQSSETIAVIGLGNMGIGMAARLVAAGRDTRGFDTSEARRKLAEDAGIACSASVEQAMTGCTVALLSLPHAPAVESVCAACLQHSAPNAVILDTSTISVASVRALSRAAAAQGRAYLDAPVSGGPAGAAAGTLTMMVGGEAAALDRVRPILAAMAGRVVHVGGSGAGQVAKLANNLMVATHMVVAAEAMRMAQAAGVDPRAVLDVVNAASGRSAATEVNLPRWVLSGTLDSGFAAGLMRKDVRLALELAAGSEVAVPVMARAAETWLNSSQDAVPADADFNQVLAWVMNGGEG